MAEPANFPHPLLLCDIGGTNVRLAEVAGPGERARGEIRFATDEDASLSHAIAARRDRFSAKPASLIVCAAGPIEGRQVKLTNARWIVDGPEIAAALGLRQGLLLNDFEAQAITLAHLRPDAVRPIGSVKGPESGTRLVLGPGTGLGAALLLEWQGRFMPLTTEAGHMDFGPASPFEHELWGVLHRGVARITGETLLSGRGMLRLYEALCTLEGAQPATKDPAGITTLAFENRNGIEARAQKLFWVLTARYAGQLALGLVAKGGVTLSGGILPKIVDFLEEGEFRRAFDEQVPLQALVEKIPVRLVTDPHAVLDGLASLAAAPDLFLIDYRTRLWR